VIGSSPDQLWLQKYLEFHCDDCGSNTGFRSRRRSFSERYLLPIFLLQPARCAECFRRDYRSLFVPLKNRMSETIRRAPDSSPQSERNVA
jgi:hypothetical protein